MKAASPGALADPMALPPTYPKGGEPAMHVPVVPPSAGVDELPPLDVERHARRAQPVDQRAVHRRRRRQHAGAREPSLERQAEGALPSITAVAA